MPRDTTCRKIQSWHCTGWSGRQWLIIAGAGGSAQAQYQLFRYYFEGQYGAPDYSQAMEWLEWAAQGGVVEAQDALGSLYLYGENVPEDRKKRATG